MKIEYDKDLSKIKDTAAGSSQNIVHTNQSNSTKDTNGSQNTDNFFSQKSCAGGKCDCQPQWQKLIVHFDLTSQVINE